MQNVANRTFDIGKKILLLFLNMHAFADPIFHMVLLPFSGRGRINAAAAAEYPLL